MTTWTNRDPIYNSPDLNSVSTVINDISDTLTNYQMESQWSKRGKPSDVWGVEYGLWVSSYRPWGASAYPWLRGSLSTNWTKRTPI